MTHSFRTCAGGALALAVAVAVAVAGEASATSGSTPDPARCPLKASSTIPSGEAWAFSDSGAPSNPHPGISSTYVHGRGTWTHGHGSGTICIEASAPGHASRNLVLTVTGSAHISTEITRLGHLGVGLVLNVSVNASDDQTCLPGTRGTTTLFASYFEGHFDSAQFHLIGSCAVYDYKFSGPRLLALIARDGGAVR